MAGVTRIIINMQLGAADASMIVEGVPYSPDVADDLLGRVKQALEKAVQLGAEVGTPSPWLPGEIPNDEDDCEDLEADEDASTE
jgi:hypothetical protein